MQWRIINDHRPLLQWTADKLAQKEYVKEIAQRNNLPIRIPATLWAGQEAEELINTLHSYREGWVFKPNHSSSRYRLYERGLDGVDRDELRSLTHRWSARDEEELVYGNWAYRHARHLLIAEERIGTASTPPIDIRVYCYGGRAHVLFNTYGVNTPELRGAYYTPELERTSAGFFSEIPRDEPTAFDAVTPSLQAQIVPIAEAIAAPFDEMRVDLYVADGSIWFGELTTYSTGGLIKVDDAVDRARGELWRLPNLSTEDPRDDEWRNLLRTSARGVLQKQG